MRLQDKSSFFELLGALVMRVVRASPKHMEPPAQPLFGSPFHEHAADSKFQPDVDWDDYRFFDLAPAIYSGSESRCGRISEEDRSELAQYMLQQFEMRLRQRYTQVAASRRGTLRIEIALTDVTLVEPVKGESRMSEVSVRYTLKIYDATTRRLLRIYTDEQPPRFTDIWPAADRLFAAKSGIRWAARQLMANLC